MRAKDFNEIRFDLVHHSFFLWLLCSPKKGRLILAIPIDYENDQGLGSTKKKNGEFGLSLEKRIETKERFDLSLSLVIEVVEPREPDRETSQTKMNSYYIIL